MIVADTSALVSLATASDEDVLFEEFDVHTTAAAIEELEDTAAYDDASGDAARSVLDERDRLSVHAVETPAIDSSRIDPGEASCIALVRNRDADFLLTDDHRALPELRALVDAQIATSPIVLKALVERDALAREAAVNRLEEMADDRSWLETPIYRDARRLFRQE